MLSKSGEIGIQEATLLLPSTSNLEESTMKRYELVKG